MDQDRIDRITAALGVLKAEGVVVSTVEGGGFAWRDSPPARKPANRMAGDQPVVRGNVVTGRIEPIRQA